MQSNRIKAVLIMLIVIVILTNYEKAGGSKIFSVNRMNKDVEYKLIRLSYDENIDEEYIKAVNETIKEMPAQLIEDISEDGMEIRIKEKKEEEIEPDTSQKMIRLYEENGTDDIGAQINKGYIKLSRDAYENKQSNTK